MLLYYYTDGAIGPHGGEVTLKNLLIFCTGADEIPALGFRPDPSLTFVHPEEVPHHLLGMPLASTCSLQLKLPIVKEFDTFKQNMLSAIEMVSTFTAS